MATEMTTPWREHYCAPWLTMNPVWHGQVSLHKERHLARPDHLLFATCLLLAPAFWFYDESVAHWLTVAPMSKPRMLTLLPAIQCWLVYEQRFLCGEVMDVKLHGVEEDRAPLYPEQRATMERLCPAHGEVRDAGVNKALRIRVEGGTGKSRVLNDICWMSSLPDGDPRRHPPTGILSEAYRRSWATCDNIIVDTFDGANDTLQKCVESLFHLAQFDIWITDE